MPFADSNYESQGDCGWTKRTERGWVEDQPQHAMQFDDFLTGHALRLVFDPTALHTKVISHITRILPTIRHS
ncbi:MAG: hypothetical protein IH623_27645 [Verrucomicrobia bacterium]|nr:hypothetical protein [Verrucomicrobiota bacterium]